MLTRIVESIAACIPAGWRLFIEQERRILLWKVTARPTMVGNFVSLKSLEV